MPIGDLRAGDGASEPTSTDLALRASQSQRANKGCASKRHGANAPCREPCGSSRRRAAARTPPLHAPRRVRGLPLGLGWDLVGWGLSRSVFLWTSARARAFLACHPQEHTSSAQMARWQIFLAYIDRTITGRADSPPGSGGWTAQAHGKRRGRLRWRGRNAPATRRAVRHARTATSWRSSRSARENESRAIAVRAPMRAGHSFAGATRRCSHTRPADAFRHVVTALGLGG